jgi:hypothetical protein
MSSGGFSSPIKTQESMMREERKENEDQQESTEPPFIQFILTTAES